MNILKRGFAEPGLGWPEDTPVVTVAVPQKRIAFPVDKREICSR